MGWPITEPSAIYAIRCKNTGRVYVGRTSNLQRRLREHFTELRKNRKDCRVGRCHREISLFQMDFNKYGEENFEVYILEEDVQPAFCKEREAFWIRQYKAADPEFGYNKLKEEIKNKYAFKTGLPPRKDEA